MRTTDVNQQKQTTRREPSASGQPGRAEQARTRRVRRVATGAIAAGAATAAWALARAVGVEITSPEMGTNPVAPIGAAHVVVAALVAWAAGWGALAALERLAPSRAQAIWLVTAVLVLIASLGAPLTGAGISAATRGVLVALHLLVAAILGAGFARSRA